MRLGRSCSRYARSRRASSGSTGDVSAARSQARTASRGSPAASSASPSATDAGTKRGAEVSGGGGRLAPRELEPAELVIPGGQPLRLGVTLALRREREDALLDGDGLVPRARLHR